MAVENFLTNYTEEDGNNKLTVTANKATGVDVDWDEDVYLYRNKGVDHFDALNIDVELYVSSDSLNSGSGGIGLANVIGTIGDFADTDFACRYLEGSVDWRIYLTRGAGTEHDYYVCNPDTPYYCTVVRTAGNDIVSIKVYSDSGRTDLLDTVFLANFGTEKWQYIYGFINWNATVSGRDGDGYVQNLNLNEILPFLPVADGDLIGIPVIRKS